jgi:energy-coupling factor transporter transmembrane protein EcfT
MNNKKDEISTEQYSDEDFWTNNPRVLFLLTLIMITGIFVNLLSPVRTPFNIVMLILMFGLLLFNGYRFIDRLIAEIKR